MKKGQGAEFNWIFVLFAVLVSNVKRAIVDNGALVHSS